MHSLCLAGVFLHEVCSITEGVVYDFSGLDIFCVSVSVRSLCLPGMFSIEVCNFTEGVVYLVPGIFYTTETFPPHLLVTYLTNKQRV